MPTGKLMTFLMAVTAAGISARAAAQIDPIERTYLQGGTQYSVRGNGPTLGYGFLLINRPHIGGQDNYLRVAAAPPYVRVDWVHDNWPFKDTAVGIGGRGGLFSQNFYDYHSGRYTPQRSFRGHSAGLAFTYSVHPYKIMGRIPVDLELRMAPSYLMYRRMPGTDSQFIPPDDGPVYSYRAGMRIGGVPPLLAASRALQLTLWYEADHRAHSGAYGLPGGGLRTRSWTNREWLRLGGIIPLPHGQVVSLFYATGRAGAADPLSTFRLGGSLRFQQRFPLRLHGYYEREVFATGYRLVNAFYRFPLYPGQRRVKMQLDFDYANVTYFPGYALPHRDLTGLGADLIWDWSKSLRVVTGYGYAPQAVRDGGFGGSIINVRMQLKL